MKRIAIIALLLTAVPAEAQLLRRVFGGGRSDCGPNGCQVQLPPQQFVLQPERIPAHQIEEPRQFEAWQLGGVDRDKVNGHEEPEYNVSGKKCSKKEAYQALAGANLDDDSGKLWLVVTPPQDKAVEEFKSKLPDLASRTRVIQYPSGHFFASKYTPGVTLMRPNGEELYKSDTFDVESLKRADPNYVPDPTKQNWLPVLVLGGFVAVLFLLRRMF